MFVLRRSRGEKERDEEEVEKEKEKKPSEKRTDVARLAEQHAVFDFDRAVRAKLSQALDLRGEARDVGVDVEHGRRERRSRVFFLNCFF